MAQHKKPGRTEAQDVSGASLQPASASAPSAGTPSQPAGASAPPTGTPSQPAGASAPPPGTPSQPAGASVPPPGTPSPPSGASAAPADAIVATRRAQYMISPRRTLGVQPLAVDFVVQQLMNSPEISVVKTIEPPRLFALQSIDGPALSPLVLARMAQDKAKQLQTQAGARLAVERDLPLTLTLEPGPGEIRFPNPGILVPHADGFSVTFEILGESGALAEAEVFVFGAVWPSQSVTDASGRVSMTIMGESPDTIRALYVKPKADYWSFWLDRPQLVPNTLNRVAVKPLGAYLRDFPGRQLLGWGERAMGLDRVPPSFDGAGVKVAVIDSGAAQTHRNLRAVSHGASIVGNDRRAWTVDTIGHGSHCAGIIGGGPAGTGGGIRGFAPAAEIHVCRIFPGGRFSDLIGALDYCMENGVDVVNMSLGGGEPSQIIEERVIRAKQMGIACIVAAGNSSGPVQFPASTPHALAVAAMGKWGEFPAESFHAQQALDGFQSRDGYFPAKFSCFGPEVDVCAPGVAIVSSLPADGFGAWDGTSMAAPHVTGLAALILAHHPDFKGTFQNRNALRVERLFQIIKETATPIQFGDPSRSGAGLPNAPRALGLEAGAPASAPSVPPSEMSFEALRRLLGLLRGEGQPVGLAPQSVGVMSEPASGPQSVPRGPAMTTGDLSRLFAVIPLAPTEPTPNEIRDVLTRAGLL